MGRSSFEIPLEFISTLLMSELALLCRKLFPTTSQESDRPRENVDADNEFRALCVNGRRSLAIQCSCACQRLLRFCTSSRFGKFVSVSSLGFVALLATVQALCSLTSQVLELYRLDEIVVLYQVSCPRNSLHCTSSRCSATQSCLLDVAVRQCLPVFELLSCEDQSLLVGMNAFLVFTLVMVSLAFFSHHWNASCCC